MRFSNSTR
jgi:uncharacterized coiled-coil protein SlyX